MYLLLLLGMSSDSLNKWQAAGYYNEVSLGQVDPSPASDGDALIKARYDRFSGGKSVVLRGPLLSAGICQCARVLPALAVLKFRFVKNNGAFLITKLGTTAGEFQLCLEDVYLKIKR